MILGPIVPSEEEIVTATTKPAISVPTIASFTSTVMGTSSNISEIGSLAYQDPMEYVNDEQQQQEQNCLNNGLNAVEIIFTNTPAQQAINSVSGTQSEEDIFNQILSNTSTRCLQQQQTIKPDILAELQQHLNANYHHNSIAIQPIQPQQLAAAITSCSQQGQFQAKDDTNIFTLSPNVSSPTTMNFDEFTSFMPADYDLCEEKDSKLQLNLQNNETMFWEKNCYGANDALVNGMDPEETFEITHENEGMILTSTQELIIAEGISTEDFNAFQNTIIDKDGEFFTTIYNDRIDEPDTSGKIEIKLETDPMLSVDILGTGTNTPCPESPDVKYDFPTNVVLDEKAAQQLLDLMQYAESGPKKGPKAGASGLALRKNKGQNLNLNIVQKNIPERVDLTTADVVQTVFTWETANVKNEFVQSPLNNASLPPSSSNSINEHTSSAFLYDDVTQSSQLSDSRFEFSGFATTPPTPLSTASYETAGNTERKRRGRPPKTHSAEPDPAMLEEMSPSQRKYYLLRLKNNAASRQSRRNRKGKQQQQSEEEAVQRYKNDSLRRQVAKWEHKEMLLKDMLRKQIGASN